MDAYELVKMMEKAELLILKGEQQGTTLRNGRAARRLLRQGYLRFHREQREMEKDLESRHIV